MVLMIRQEMCGGVSTISNPFTRANNKYMGEVFDSSKPYLDTNNLYG